jgi:hypothetical protein
LTNPAADLITLPLQMNFDDDVCPEDDGTRFTANVQPVAPFDLGEDWNLITGTILPITRQEAIFPGAGSEFGLGDVNFSPFFSPKAAGAEGVVWGAGPVFELPTATDSQLGSEKWRAGPSAVGRKRTFGPGADRPLSAANGQPRADTQHLKSFL